jgi:hypothetical protein
MCSRGEVFSIDFRLSKSHHQTAMDADEREICIYLKSWGGQFVSVGEISRRAGGKRRYREDPNWAVLVLGRLVEKGLVESDSTGHYRLKPKSKKDKQKWVSPQVRAILERSGKNFEEVLRVDEDDEEFLKD